MATRKNHVPKVDWYENTGFTKEEMFEDDVL